MYRSRVLILCCFLVLTVAPTSSHGGDEKTQAMARPCPVDSAGYMDAKGHLERLAAQMNGLNLDGDPRPAAQAMKTLFGHQCFDFMPSIFMDLSTVDSGLSLITLWRDGAEAWFESALALGDPKQADRRYWVLPGLRKTLTREAAPSSPLTPLLCSVHDTECARETRGWRRRADAALRTFQSIRDAASREHRTPETRSPWIPSQCEAWLRARGKLTFSAWTRCVDNGVEKHPVLPLGQMRAPGEGWLLVSGRRGHYAFCDEVRAYDLKTGAAYISSSCSHLRLMADGQVAHDATHRERRTGVKIGRLPVQNLREAAWMILLADTADLAIIPSGLGIHIPLGLVVESTSRGMDGLGMSYSGSSNQTLLKWQVTMGKTILGQGDLTWPKDYNHAGAQHAVSLLQIAEAAFEEGCPPTSAPLVLAPPSRGGGVSVLDARPEDLRRVNRTLWNALGKALSASPCKDEPAPNLQEVEHHGGER